MGVKFNEFDKTKQKLNYSFWDENGNDMKRTSTPKEIRAKIPKGETQEEFFKRIKEEMRKTEMVFTKSGTMKERKYENTLHFILGVIGTNDMLDSADLNLIKEKVISVLENEEPQKQVIRG